MELKLVEWSPDSKHILFVSKESEVHIYDATGETLYSFLSCLSVLDFLMLFK